MAQIPTNLMDKEIEVLGELVTITVKSGETYSDWGDETATETATTDVKAIFNVYSHDRNSNEEGKFLSTEMGFFFKSDQTGLELGTKVTRANAEVYSISDIRAHGVQGSIYVQEAIVKKV